MGYIIGLLVLYYFFLNLSTVKKEKTPVLSQYNNSLSNSVKEYIPLIETLCSKYKYSYPKVVAAIIQIESNGNENAVGQSGELGLMQIMPIALQDVNENFGTNFQFEDLAVASNNISVGILFLKLQLKRMKNLNDSIRAYNAGERGARLGRGYDYLEKVKLYL